MASNNLQLTAKDTNRLRPRGKGQRHVRFPKQSHYCPLIIPYNSLPYPHISPPYYEDTSLDPFHSPPFNGYPSYFNPYAHHSGPHPQAPQPHYEPHPYYHSTGREQYKEPHYEPHPNYGPHHRPRPHNEPYPNYEPHPFYRPHPYYQPGLSPQYLNSLLNPSSMLVSGGVALRGGAYNNRSHESDNWRDAFFETTPPDTPPVVVREVTTPTTDRHTSVQRKTIGIQVEEKEKERGEERGEEKGEEEGEERREEMRQEEREGEGGSEVERVPSTEESNEDKRRQEIHDMTKASLKQIIDGKLICMYLHTLVTL